VFLALNAKLHVSEQKFNVRKCKTMRLDESYRLVTTVLVLNSPCGKIQNIFLTTIAVVVGFQPRGTFSKTPEYFSIKRIPLVLEILRALSQYISLS
jgi:hypothetical protein